MTEQQSNNPGYMKILEKEVKAQEWKLVRDIHNHTDEENVKINLTPEEQARQEITDAEIITLAKIGKQLEDHYDFPQDIEWATEKGEIFIVQRWPDRLRHAAAPHADADFAAGVGRDV